MVNFHDNACAQSLAASCSIAEADLHGALHPASIDAAILPSDRIRVGDLLALIEDHAWQCCAAAALHSCSHSRLCRLQATHSKPSQPSTCLDALLQRCQPCITQALGCLCACASLADLA